MPERPGRSLVLRYTLAYVALFVVSVTAVLGVLYWSTLRLEDDALGDAVEAEAQALRGELAGLEVTQRAAVVTRWSAAMPGGNGVYMLAGTRYEWVAGNLRTWPDGEDDEGSFEFPLGSGDDAHVVARAAPLSGGQRLLVGRNTAELAALRARARAALLWTPLVVLVLGGLGGFVISRRISGRLAALGARSDAVLAGDLRQRMPLTGRGDELDVLASSLNRMLDRIEALMAGMREVSDNVAHDMRSPLSRLRSRVEVALLGPPDAVADRQVLVETIVDLDAVLATFNALLAIARAESGEPRERFEAVDLAAVARDVVDVYEPAAEDAGLTLVVDAPAAVMVQGERHLLGQALANVLENAIKYAPGSGAVDVRVSADGGEARVSVRDRGPGMSQAFRARAFERFTRGETSRTTSGSGLGLSLVRAVATLHEGRVELADAAPGLDVVLVLPVTSGLLGLRGR